MWKNTPEDQAPPAPSREPGPATTSKSATGPVASLGPSLVIRGTLSGKEDLIIEGRVEGEISLRQHSVTVGPKGRVKADVFSKSICVEGEVEGNLFGEDQVTIRRSGKVRGNVTSPRVSLEDGSKFKGAIDMKSPPPASDSEPNDSAGKSGAVRDRRSSESSEEPAGKADRREKRERSGTQVAG